MVSMSCCNFVNGTCEVRELQGRTDQAELPFSIVPLAPQNRQETIQQGSHAETCCTAGVRWKI